MNRIVKRIAALLVPMLFWSLTLEACGQDDPCAPSFLPVPVQKLLAERYLDWRPLTVSDLEEAEREVWMKSPHQTRCPGIAEGFFQSRESRAYALLLIPIDPDQPGYRLVVFARDRKGQWEEGVLSQSDEIEGNDSVIYTMPPGRYRDFYQEFSPVQLTLDGFVQEFEVQTILFYWKDGRYQELLIRE